MNKSELVEKVAISSNISKAKALNAVNALLDSIEDSLSKKKDVTLIGFGTFKTRNRAPRLGNNPKTGERIEIPGACIPAFTAGKKLKESVSK